MHIQKVVVIASVLILAGSSVAWIEGTQPVATRPLTPPIATAEISDDAVTTAKISPDGGSPGQVLTVTAGPDIGWSAVPSDGDWTISGTDVYSTVTGNVGIGTTTPNAKLHVVNTTDRTAYFQVDNTTSGYSAVTGWTNGIGWAGFFQSDNAAGRALYIRDVLKIEPRPAPPGSPSTGYICVATDNHMYCYLGGGWKQLDN